MQQEDDLRALAKIMDFLQTLCTAPACPLMPRHEGSHQREDYLAENLGSPRYRICVLLHH